MLDKTKAFHTVDRAIFLINLKTILDPYEFHRIKIMLNAELAIRCEAEESNFFKTDTSVPQRDGLSANEFTIYLVGVLSKENNDHICKKFTITISSKLSPLSKYDHRKDIDEHFAIYQEYSDDMSAITSDKKG